MSRVWGRTEQKLALRIDAAAAGERREQALESGESLAPPALVSAVEYLADGSGVVGHFGEVAVGGLDRGVAEAAGDDVDGHAFAGECGRVERAQDVRMAEPLGDAGRLAVAADELVQRRVGQRYRIGAGVAA